MAWLGENTGYMRHTSIIIMSHRVVRHISHNITLPYYVLHTHSILLSEASYILMYATIINSIKKLNSPFCSSSWTTSKLLYLAAECNGVNLYTFVTLRGAPTKKEEYRINKPK